MNRGPFVGCRIRARKLRPGDECFFCLWSRTIDANPTQNALAFVYFMGHQHEATADGPSLCDACMSTLLRIAKERTEALGGTILDLNSKKGRPV